MRTARRGSTKASVFSSDGGGMSATVGRYRGMERGRAAGERW